MNDQRPPLALRSLAQIEQRKRVICEETAVSELPSEHCSPPNTYASSTASRAAFSILYLPPFALALDAGVTKDWNSPLVNDVGRAGTSCPVCGEIL